MDVVTIMLKEYDTLRGEILATLSGRNTFLTMWQALVGVIISISIGTRAAAGASLFSGWILALLVPVLSGFTLFMWLGEYQRMQRAGRFLVEVEEKINKAAGRTVLSWETAGRFRRHHMRYPYVSTVLLMAVTSGIAYWLGVTLVAKPDARWKWLLAGGLVHLLAGGYAVWRIGELRK